MATLTDSIISQLLSCVQLPLLLPVGLNPRDGYHLWTRTIKKQVCLPLLPLSPRPADEADNKRALNDPLEESCPPPGDADLGVPAQCSVHKKSTITSSR